MLNAAKYDRIGSIFYMGQDNVQCRNNVLTALEAIDTILEQENGGANLQEQFNLCHPIDTANANEIGFFYEALLDYIIDYIEQFQYETHLYRSEKKLFYKRHMFLSNRFAGVNNICRDIRAIQGNQLASLIRWFNHVRNSDECIDWSYNSFVEANSNTEWGQPSTELGGKLENFTKRITETNHFAIMHFNIVRQWFYLQCTQSSLFQVTDLYTWMPNRIQRQYRTEQCQDVLGEK